MAFWCKGKKDYCTDTSCEACNKCKFENGSGGIELEDDDTDGIIIRQWISVKDRLPETGVNVLVYIINVSRSSTESLIELDQMRSNGKWWLLGNNGSQKITHWMPLPEPPKEG